MARYLAAIGITLCCVAQTLAQEWPAGTVRIVAIQPAFSTAVMESPFDAKRGDRVRYIGH